MQIVLTVVLFALAYLCLASPRLPKRNFPAPELVAHRGLFDNENGVPENSLPAFSLACERGYAIELDVHLTADGQLVVFHDEDLRRACGAPGDPREMTLAQLKKNALFGTDSRIPTLDEALTLVGGRVPLVIELKTTRRCRALASAAMQRLRRYQGPFVIESFNPLILLFFRRRCPQVIRGQLVTQGAGHGLWQRLGALLLGALLANWLSRPDFIAYDRRMDRSLTLFVQRRLFRSPLAVWTVKSRADCERLRSRARMVIFEGFAPAAPRSRSSESPSGTSTP